MRDHPSPSTPSPAFSYETVPGYFLQDDPGTNAEDFDPTSNNLGLIPPLPGAPDPASPTTTPWQRFATNLSLLQSQAQPQRTSYKLLLLARHGEGVHNVAEAYYGTAPWDATWSKLDGNGTLRWADAHLTTNGESQARAARALWHALLAGAGMPAPEAYYVSPLWRCLQTAALTFGDLALPGDRPFDPVVKELAREVLGEHSCDRRSDRSAIQAAYPAWRIEEGFAERDGLWRAERRETAAEHDVRTTSLLDDICIHDRATYVSITSHSGTIASLLRVTGHREFPVPTGGIIPVLIRATRRS